MASRDCSILKENARLALGHLGVLGSRNATLLVDETTWAPSWDLMVGLRDSMGYVGGFADAEGDFTFVPCSDAKEDLPESRLSKLSVHYVVTRADTNAAAWCVDWLPRAPATAAQAAKMGASKTLEDSLGHHHVLLGLEEIDGNLYFTDLFMYE